MDSKLMTAAIIICVVLALIVYWLFSRKSVEINTYLHAPSHSYYYDKLSFTDASLAPFTHHDVLWLIDIKKKTHQDNIIWLGLHSVIEGQSLQVNDVSIKGATGEIEQGIDEHIVLKNKDSRGNFVHHIALFELTTADLEALFSHDGMVQLSVRYTIDGAQFEQQFTLQQRTQTQTVFPT